MRTKLNTIKSDRCDNINATKINTIKKADWSIIDIDWKKEYETMERIYNEWVSTPISYEFNG